MQLLLVHYQPKLDLSTRRIVGLEALVRWQHPSLGLLQPAAFIDMAEQTGLIRPLTHAVLEQALRECAACHAQGMDVTVAVNVSPRSLMDPRLVDIVEKSLRSCALPANRLNLEITETAIMLDGHGQQRSRRCDREPDRRPRRTTGPQCRRRRRRRPPDPRRLTRMGCDQAQGYLISRPPPAQHIASWLRDHPTLFAESLGRGTLRAVAG